VGILLSSKLMRRICDGSIPGVTLWAIEVRAWQGPNSESLKGEKGGDGSTALKRSRETGEGASLQGRSTAKWRTTLQQSKRIDIKSS